MSTMRQDFHHVHESTRKLLPATTDCAPEGFLLMIDNPDTPFLLPCRDLFGQVLVCAMLMGVVEVRQ